MFCEKCGKQVDGNWKNCPNCGAQLECGENNIVDDRGGLLAEENNKKKKPLYKRGIFWLLMIVFVFAGLIFIGSDDSSTLSGEEVASNLYEFLEVSQDDHYYEFTSDTELRWVFRCGGNNTLRIYDQEVVDVFIDYVGDGFDGDYYFVYDISENRAAVYLDEDICGVSIINYMYDEEEFDINADGKHWYASDELEEYMEQSGVIDKMKQDIDSIEKMLGEHGLTFSDLEEVTSEDVELILD